MNMFEKMNHGFEEENDAYEYGDQEIDNQIQSITYTSDAVRISYIPRKDIIECGFLQDDVKVYLTFISTDISDFSESFSNEALTAIAQSDADCVGKFDKICELIFSKKLDKSIIEVSNGISTGSRSSAGDFSVKEYSFSFYAFYRSTQITFFFSAKEKKELKENVKIGELANRIIDFDSILV